jgi:hypothetical protein
MFCCLCLCEFYPNDIISPTPIRPLIPSNRRKHFPLRELLDVPDDLATTVDAVSKGAEAPSADEEGETTGESEGSSDDESQEDGSPGGLAPAASVRGMPWPCIVSWDVAVTHAW